MSGVLDLHVDSIIQQRLFRYDVRRRHRAGVGGQPLFWHADIPRMVEAGYRGACMGVHYWPWESEKGWREMKRQIAYLDDVAATDERTLRIWSHSDWERARAEQKLALVPGVEGAHMLNGRIERVAELAELGVAYLTLTHFSTNSAATSSMGRGANQVEGLTAFGRQLVRELNRYGVAVDLAHVNTPGVLDACEVSESPLFCTHTCARSLHDSPRNITDAEIDAIAATGGVMGIIFAPAYLCGKLRCDTEVALDHLEYIAERVGVEHVAIGSDYDGWLPTILSDHRDCRDIVRIAEGLRRRGWREGDLQKVKSENALRVLQEVEAKAEVRIPSR